MKDSRRQCKVRQSASVRQVFSVGLLLLFYLKHLARSFGEPDEDTIVDLQKTKQLKSLALLGVDLVDTSPNN